MTLLCPICKQPLQQEEKAFRCGQNHCFDIARQGYVNLLPVQQKHSLFPGDTREQVLSRRRFLDSGFYAPSASALCRMAKELDAQGPILDVGCGEGYYSSLVARALQCPLTGLDISKEAVRCAAAKYKDARWLCATAASLPVAENSVGLLMSLFALTVPGEFRRVLKQDGLFFQVLAAEDHLLGLKRLIYPELTHKEKNTTPEVPGFSLVRSEAIRFSFVAEGQQVMDLLSMTPHVYRIGAEGAQRLRETERLEDTASCVLNVFRPL